MDNDNHLSACCHQNKKNSVLDRLLMISHVLFTDNYVCQRRRGDAMHSASRVVSKPPFFVYSICKQIVR